MGTKEENVTTKQEKSITEILNQFYIEAKSTFILCLGFIQLVLQATLQNSTRFKE